MNNIDILCELKYFHEDETYDGIHRYCPYLCSTLIWDKMEDFDTMDQLCYIVAMTTDKFASMLPPTEESFKQHILQAKYQTRILCDSHIPSQAEVEPVGHGWSACEDGCITQTTMSDFTFPRTNDSYNLLYDSKEMIFKVLAIES